MSSGDATYLPIKNTAYRAYFPILDADGDPVPGASGLDSEVSIDGASMADCTNEATYISDSAGSYYLDLVASEMNSSCSLAEIKSNAPGKTTVLTMYPVEEADYGTATQIKLASALTNIAALENVSTADIVTHTTSALVTIDVAQASAVAAIVDYAQASALTTVDGKVTDVAQASTLTTISGHTDNIASVQTAVDGIKTITDALPDSGALTGISDETDKIASVLTDIAALENISTADIVTHTTSALVTIDVAQASAITAINTIVTGVAQASSLTAVDTKVTDVAQASALTTVDGKVTDVAQASAIAALNNIAATDITDDIDANSTQLAAILTSTAAMEASYAQASALLTAAAVKTQVASALSSDTYTELGAGTATTTASISTKLSYLHQVLINKNTSTSVLASIYAADGSTTVMTSTVSSDGTTYTKGRFS